MWAPLGSLVGGLSTGDICKALETAIFVHRGTVGQHVGGGGVPFTGNSWEIVEGGLWKWRSLSLSLSLVAL